MHSNWWLFVSLSFVTAPVVVYGCEGYCIVGITNAFLGNYTSPIHHAFDSVAVQLLGLFPNGAMSQQSALSALQPIADAFQNQSYLALRTAIFPDYFHGKCQVNGVDPPGCPNPNCPVVCGTPGSLVYFYPKLRQIAFDCMTSLGRNLSSPSSESYHQVERTLLAYSGVSNKSGKVHFTKGIRNILGRFSVMVLKACGGSELSRCSWEADMKSYILSFP